MMNKRPRLGWVGIKLEKFLEINENLPPRKPALTPSYEEILSTSTIGGGRVSLVMGGKVTGSTPQKSSVSVAK